MMRYQRVSPDCHPLSNGRKPSLRACNEDAADAGDSTVRIPNYSSSFDAKPLRARSASGSASTTPDRPPFSHFTFPDSDAAVGGSNGGVGGSPSPAPKSVNGVCGGGVLLQWGHKKRSRGSRAEGRQVAAGDDSSSGGQSSRQVVKIQRRAAAAAAAAVAAATAMPPPGASYTRGANLRPCTPVRDATSPLRNNRTVEERSGGQHKRAPPSPPEKPHPNGEGAADAAADRDPPVAGGGGGGEKVNLEQFEWPRIFISLSRKEKEDDFMAMKGTKLPQRPKKRAKNVDKTLQYCFPGMWLSDLTRGRYEVREKKCVKKKRRGLKGMESMDSDSE